MNRMKHDQHGIYCVTGEDITAVSSSPIPESFSKKGLQSLYTVDPIDEYSVQQMKKLDSTKLKSTTKEDLGIDDMDKQKQTKELRVEFETLAELMKKVIGDRNEEVLVSGTWRTPRVCSPFPSTVGLPT